MPKETSTNFENRQVLNTCPVTYTITLIGGRWKPIILWSLVHGTHRFSELKRGIPMITEKMLTQQLRELEADGLVARQVYQEVPPKVEYSLTPLGQSLQPVLESMLRWGVTQLKKE
jgi:DNA-binding HxlR family transcriptional regulator